MVDNYEIIKEYGRKKGIKEEDLDNYVRRTVRGFIGI